MKVRNWTTPLVCATINTSCSGTSIVVAAFTSWTPPPAQSLCCVTRDRPSLKSACTTLSSSKVLENTSQIYYLLFHPSMLIQKFALTRYILMHIDVCSSTGSNACRVYNGGCSSLCLAIPGGRQCACAEDQILDPADNTSCKGEFKHTCFVCACKETIHENVDKQGVAIITEAPA